MAGKLHLIVLLEPQHFFKLLPQRHQDIFALLRATALAAGDVALTAARDALADRLGPQPNAVEAFADVDDDAHHFAVRRVAFEGFADGGEHNVQPKVIDRGRALVFELVRPFAAVFVLRVFPFGADAFVEEVVVGFQRQFGSGTDIVLECERDG